MQRVVLCLAVLAAAPSLALAEEASAPPSRVEIVIVASPLDQARKDILQGVTALNRAEIGDLAGGGLGETLARTPGVASSYFGAGASRPIIRGLGEDRIRILSGGLGQIDAAAVSPDHAVSIEPLEAEAIEVLRGPAALAYGGGAIGGVVNVVDQRIAEAPAERPVSGQVLAGVGTGTNELQAAGGVTLARGPFTLRLEALTRDNRDFAIPGFAFSPAVRADEAKKAAEEGEEAPEFARGRAPNSFAQADQGVLGFSVSGGWGFAGLAVKRLDSLYGIPKAGHKHSEDEASGEEKAEEAAIFAGPRIDLSQTRYEARFGLNQLGGFLQSLRVDAAAVDYQHTEIEETGDIGTRFTNEGFEARIELRRRKIGGFEGVFGLSGLSTDFDAEGEEAFITPTKTDELGAFWIERLIRGPFSLEGGVRLERRELENAVSGTRRFDLVSASLGGAWRPTAQSLLGVTFASTERGPTETELFANGPHLATSAFEIGDPRLKEERAQTLEVVARWRNERARVELNLYHSAFDGFIALIADGAEEDDLPVFRFTQRDATFTGGEITAAAMLFEGGWGKVSVDAGLDLVRAEFDAGGNLPRIPPRTLRLGLDAETGRFRGRVELEDIAKQTRVAAFESETEGAQVVNARVSFRPVAGADRLVFTLDGRNLTDEDVRVHTSFVKGLLPRPGRSIRLMIGAEF